MGNYMNIKDWAAPKLLKLTTWSNNLGEADNLSASQEIPLFLRNRKAHYPASKNALHENWWYHEDKYFVI